MSPEQQQPIPTLTILAIDPGKTSGFIKATTTGPHNLPALLSWGAWRDLKEFHRIIPVFDGVNFIVVEDYRIYAHRAQAHIGSQVITAKVIGAIEYVAIIHDPPIPVHLQGASQAKVQWSDTRLRLHYHRKTLRQFKSRHVLDALRHLLTYIENQTPTGTIISPSTVPI